ncbi:MAG: hypothetical protein U0694_06295 [Anaerolineae bacterium]
MMHQFSEQGVHIAIGLYVALLAVLVVSHGWFYATCGAVLNMGFIVISVAKRQAFHLERVDRYSGYYTVLQRFEWLIVQEGQLPLRPDKHFLLVEHRPTVTLIWRAGEQPKRDNSLLVDPYFTENGFLAAQRTLRTAGFSFFQLGAYFVTHQHFDHMLSLPLEVPAGRFKALAEPLEGIRAVPCPGHARDLHALVFTSRRNERIWVVSDAVLDETWLRAWGYYYPNGYAPSQIIETWRSIAAIFAEAEVIIPGHGAPIRVTRGLVEALIEGFPQAEFSGGCPEVLDTLRSRLAALPTNAT